MVHEAQSIKIELAEIKQSKAIFKAKAKWIQLGERPSSYFLGPEKRQAKDKCITSLQDEEGRILTQPTDILDYERRYFDDIYNEDPTRLDPIQDVPLLKKTFHRQQSRTESSITCPLLSGTSIQPYNQQGQEPRI